MTDIQLQEFLRDRYGLVVMSMDALHGFDDHNYHVIARTQASVTSPPRSFCLKVINEEDSRTPDKILAVNALMKFSQAAGVSTQSTISDMDGREASRLSCPGEKYDGRLVCLRSWLPGILLSQVNMTPDRLFRFGQYVPEISSSLLNFRHPFYQKYKFTWRLDNVSDVLNKLWTVSGETRRELVRAVVNEFEDQVLPLCGQFTRGQIHGDLNLCNVLVSSGGHSFPSSDRETDNSPLVISGLLDFQDSHISYTVFELAVALAHVTLTTRSQLDPLVMPAHVIAGYQSRHALNWAELHVLPVCVAARLSQLLVYGEFYHHKDPNNNSVRENPELKWRLLLEIWNKRQQLELSWGSLGQG